MNTQSFSGSIILFSRAPWSQSAKSRLRASEKHSDSFINELHSRFVRDAVDLLSQSSARNNFCIWEVQSESQLMKLQETFPEVPHHIRQRGENFPERFQNALQSVRLESSEEVFIIGSDCPMLSPQILETAITHCRQGSAVIGPAPSGGFYLLAVPSHFPIPDFRNLFTKGNEIEEVKKILAQKVEIAKLPMLTDIDHPEDIQTLSSTINDARRKKSWIPRATASFLSEYT